MSARKPKQPPQPSPQHRWLDYFVGQWLHEGEIKASAFGPAGKFTYRETCEWFAGNFALVCRSEGETPEGVMKGLSLISWDASAKSYAYFEINSSGEIIYSRGRRRGKTWIWTNASKRVLNGKPVRTRLTLTQVSRDLARYKFALGEGRKPLINVMQGAQRRIT